MISAIRQGNLVEFQRELDVNPAIYQGFKASFLMMALRSWMANRNGAEYDENENELICEIYLQQLVDKNPTNGIYTPLICAVLMDDARAVRKVIRAGADVDGRNILGETALIVSIHSGSLKSAQELFEHGANVDLMDRKGRNALHYACELGSLSKREEAIRLLLNNWAQVSILRVPYEIYFDNIDTDKVLDLKNVNADFNVDELITRRLVLDVQDKCGTLFIIVFMMACGILSQSC